MRIWMPFEPALPAAAPPPKMSPSPPAAPAPLLPAPLAPAPFAAPSPELSVKEAVPPLALHAATIKRPEPIAIRRSISATSKTTSGDQPHSGRLAGMLAPAAVESNRSVLEEIGRAHV